MPQAWKDLQEHKISANDVVVGIAASGTTPYIGGLDKQNNISGSISCNAEQLLKLHSFLST
jgi:N-acetylmuramic acid 6-phosphate etherase